MHNSIKQYKKKIAGIVGRDLAFEKLVEYIESQEENEELIIFLVLLLGSKCITGHKSWDNLRTSFFEKYKDSILHWCGYDTVNPQDGRFEVENEDLLLCLFALLRQFRLLGKCSYEQLAKILYATFKFKNKINTICTKLKTVYQESIYETVIQNFIRDMNKLKKK